MGNPHSFHETFGRVEKVELSSNRSFCFTFSIIFVLITAFQIYAGHPIFVLWPLLAAVFLALGITRPAWVDPLNRAWMQLGLLLAKLTNPVLLLLIYITTIVPIGLWMRACGKDPLRLKRTNNSTYWIARTPPGPAPESMTRQF